MTEKICENCKHFIQHYRKAKKNYYKINCGHCVYPLIKKREATHKACAHWKSV